MAPQLETSFIGEGHELTAAHFADLVKVTVDILKDATGGLSLAVRLAGLHASTPTINWSTEADDPSSDLDEEFATLRARLQGGMDALEADEDLPDWMSPSTARGLYGVAGRFGDTPVSGIRFRSDQLDVRSTRRTYRTLDRVLHEDTAAIGSVVGILATATLHRGPHVTITDEVSNRGVECSMGRSELTRVAGLIGERVMARGRVTRDFAGRATKIAGATVEALPKDSERVRVADMDGAFSDGPESVTWLREQRGG